MLDDRSVVVALDRFIDNTLNKVNAVNKPFKAIQKTDDYKKFQIMFEDSIKDQYKWVVDNLDGLFSSADVSDDLTPLALDQEQKIKGQIVRDMPALDTLISEVKIFQYLKTFFEWSAVQAYRRLGFMAKYDGVEFKLTNDQYIKFLKDRAAYLLNQSSLDSTTIDDIISTISEARLDGMTNGEVATILKDKYDNVSQSRADMITRTEAANSMGKANYATAKENGVTKHYWVAAGAHPCEICLGNVDDGEIPIDQEFSSGDLCEPAHPNCILPDQTINAVSIEAKLTARYDGDAVKLTFASGKTLSVTPNHLVATRSGWVEATKLDHGVDVLSTDSLIEQMATTIDPNIKPIKSLIENITISGSMVSRTVPAASVDFNGDEVSCEDIHIELANRKLRDGFNPNRVKGFVKNNLGLRYITNRVVLSCYGAFNKFRFRTLYASDSVMCGSRNSLALFGGHMAIRHPASSRMTPNSDVSLYKAFSHRHTRNPSEWGEFLNRFASFITFDKIVGVERFEYHGFVYDLTVPYNYYTTNTIITHNCECYTGSSMIDLDTINIWNGE